MNCTNQYGIVRVPASCSIGPQSSTADVVTLLPTWLAPNLITLMGVVWLMAAYVLTMCYIPDYTGTTLHNKAHVYAHNHAHWVCTQSRTLDAHTHHAHWMPTQSRTLGMHSTL